MQTKLENLPGPNNINRSTLPNGITILVKENRQSPSVVIDAFLHAGSIYEPNSKAGLANFVANMLMRGTTNASFEKIHEDLESVGTSLYFNSGVHTVNFGGKTLPEEINLLLETAADIVRNPIFPEKHIELLRSETLTGLMIRSHNTRSMASLTFYELLYGKKHPYGYSNVGYENTISSLTKQDLIDFHSHNYSPENMIITVVGNISTTEVTKLILNYFGDWKNNQRTHIAPSPKVKSPKFCNKHITIAGKTQTDIVLGYVGPKRTDPDFQSIRIANNILGVFGMYGRLGKSVRKKHGLAYYAFSRVEANFGSGTWKLIAGVDPSKKNKTINVMLEEIHSLTKKLVTSKEFSNTKSYILGSIPLQLETNEGVASTLSSMELHNLGLDYLQNLPEQINRISRPDIRNAASRLLETNSYIIASAGPK